MEDCILYTPVFMSDSAFVDWINDFLPGLELSKIKKAVIHLSQNYRLSTDYLCEILHKLRKEDFQYRTCIDLAIENRQSIADWLHRLTPEEFKVTKIGYKLNL